MDTLPGFESGTPKRNALVFLLYSLLLFVVTATSGLFPVFLAG